jgi:hypothetical protein
MLSNDLFSKPWPIHLKPKQDELLSSWLGRLSLAHGLHLSSLCSIILTTVDSSIHSSGKALWNRDIDRNIKTSILTLLAEKAAVGIEVVRNTTLVTYEGWLYERLCTQGNSVWVMSISSAPGSEKCYGLQYCPL